MSTVLPSSIPPPPASRLARFSVEQYHRMIESGAFTEDDRIELLDGWVVDKMPKKPAHSIVTGNLQDILAAQLPTGWHIRNQEPLTLSLSEPEPDLAIVAGSRNDYAQGHPTAAQTAVVIEVADTTLADDRWKQHVYAADGLPIYCLLNLPEGVVELRTSPTPTSSGYANSQIISAADPCPLTVGTATLPFRLTDVLPS